MSDMNLRRRLAELEESIKHERQQEISRAVDERTRGNSRKADYHTGLADGRNSVLAELANLTREYPPDRRRQADAAENVAVTQ